MTLPMSPFGQPIEDFLIDPPIVLTDDEYRQLGVMDSNGKIIARGVRLFEHNGVWHVLDVVGEENYPNVADFVEEARRFGISRRCELVGDEYAKLTKDSMYFLLHRKAHIANPLEYYRQWIMVNGYQPCPQNLPEHKMLLDTDKFAFDGPDAQPSCIGLCWNDVVGGNGLDHAVVRSMSWGEYTATSKPENVEPQYNLAMFFKFACGAGKIHIVNGDESAKKWERLSACELEKEAVDE